MTRRGDVRRPGDTGENLFERISARIDSYESDMVALQLGLTAIPALAPENGFYKGTQNDDRRVRAVFGKVI